MGAPGPIPFSAMRDYCDEYGYETFADRDWLYRLMGKLEDAYFEFQAEKHGSKETSPPQTTTP